MKKSKKNDGQNTRKRTRTERCFNCIWETIPTKEIADIKSSRQAVLRTTILEGIIYAAFLFFLTTYVSSRHYRWSYDVTMGLKKSLLDKQFKTINNVSINFHQIKSIADMWELKVENDTCPIYKYFSQMILRCYNAYDDDYLDTDRIDNIHYDKFNLNTTNPTNTTNTTDTDVEQVTNDGKELNFNESSQRESRESLPNSTYSNGFSSPNGSSKIFRLRGVADYIPDVGGLLPTYPSWLPTLPWGQTTPPPPSSTTSRPEHVSEELPDIPLVHNTTLIPQDEVILEQDNDTLPFVWERSWNFTKFDKPYFYYRGKFANYPSNGFIQDLPPRYIKMRNIFKLLRANLWVGLGTRVIFLHFTVYNPNVNLLCVTTLVFELPPSGGIIPSAQFVPLKLFHRSIFMKLISWCMPILYGFVVLFILQEFMEWVAFGCKYFSHFWTYWDLLIISLVILIGFLLIVYTLDINNIYKELTGGTYSNQTTLRNSKSKILLKYIDFSPLAESYIIFTNLLAILFFISCVKIVKYLDFIPVFDHVWCTITRSVPDIVAFSIMLLTIFIGFAELGYILFGTVVEDFSSFENSLFTLLRIILGDFDYMESYKANPYLASIFFFIFIFVVVFILINMFLGIIFCVYFEVKTMKKINPEMSMGEYLKSKMEACCKCFGCGRYYKTTFNTTSVMDQYREILLNCGFKDKDIDTMFKQYGVNPQAKDLTDVQIERFFAHIVTPPAKSEDIPIPGPTEPKQMKEITKSYYVRVEDFKLQQKLVSEFERMVKYLDEHLDHAFDILSD